jgi:hypothetical protein
MSTVIRDKTLERERERERERDWPDQTRDEEKDTQRFKRGVEYI